MKKALLIVSFGVASQDARKNTLDLYMKEAREAATDFDLFTAYSSKRIIGKILKREGQLIDTPLEALEKIATSGYEEIVVQSFGLICGDTFIELENQLKDYEDTFKKITLIQPLLHAGCAWEEIATLLTEKITLQPSEAVVWVGHGTYTAAQADYVQLSAALKKITPGVFLGTIKNNLTVDHIIGQLKENQITRVILKPFLLTSGHHVSQDISQMWAKGLEKAGFHVVVDDAPLATDEKVRHYFIEQIKECQHENR